jgi:hypothetical protein
LNLPPAVPARPKLMQIDADHNYHNYFTAFIHDPA